MELIDELSDTKLKIILVIVEKVSLHLFNRDETQKYAQKENYLVLLALSRRNGSLLALQRVILSFPSQKSHFHLIFLFMVGGMAERAIGKADST